MRTSLILLLALGLSTAANAQTALLAASSDASSTAALPNPGARPEASTLITQVMETEMKQPGIQRKFPKLIYIDVKGETATARVDFGYKSLTGSYYYRLALVDDQWVIKGHDNSAPVK